MRNETTRLYKDLLFLHGHVADPRLGVELGAPQEQTPASPETSREGTTMNLFKSLWLLGGLQSIDLRVGEEEEAPFGQTYGNRLASERSFGKPSEDKRDAHVRKPIVADDQRVAHC
jgi:hypothetical protein